MESISSSNSKSDRIYEFVDSIKKSISSGSTKVSDMVTSNKPTPDNPSPLLLTEDLRSMSLSPNTKSSSILNSQSPTTDKTSFSIFGSNAGAGSASAGPASAGSASAGPANVSSSTSKSSWLNVGKTTRIGIKVILVVLLLGFIGINIFVYLGFSVKTMYELLDKFIKSIKSLLSGKKSKSKPKPNPKPPQGKSSQDKSSQGKSSQGKSSQDKPKTIKDLVDDIEEPTEVLEKKTEIKPDEDRSSIHSSGKSGYCNVGSWKGIRSCVKVSKASECISGDIFPTKDICINPNLRH